MPLTSNFNFAGNGNWSLDATSGGATAGGTISVVVPENSQIEGAFLYASAFNHNANPGATLTSGAESVMLTEADFTTLDAANSFLEAHRTDVTDFVSDVVGDGDAAPFDFVISNLLGGSIDGYLLAVVYSNPDEDFHTITLLDGGSSTAGDNFAINFTEPLDLEAPGFEALFSLGIGFGFQPSVQSSVVTVNGRQLTNSAGGYDDGAGANGALITVGGIGDDPANPGNPNAGSNVAPTFDDELYNLALGNDDDASPFLGTGDTTLLVETLNPSNDDNIFFAGLNITAMSVVDSEGNDTPVAVNDGGMGFITDEANSFTTASILTNDTDPDSDTLTVTHIDGSPVMTGVPFALASGALLTVNADGTLDYDPNGQFNALNNSDSQNDVFSYTIDDGNGHTTNANVTVTINGLGGDDTMTMGGGDDDCELFAYFGEHIIGTSGADLLLGTAGSDIIDGLNGNDVILGGTGNDSIFGRNGDDLIRGNEGKDSILGGTGNDTVYGNDCEDYLSGYDGDDWLDGGRDNDTLSGGAGDDSLFGRSEDDFLYGGAGDDYMEGNSGDDRLVGGNGDDTLNGGSGNDSLQSGPGSDLLIGGGGEDTLLGGKDDDNLDGGADDDYVDGQSGNDDIDGGSGNDTLIGGAGDDTISGTEGDDILTGDSGSDQFLFGTGSDNDHITDFELAADAIKLFGFTAADVITSDLGGSTLIEFDDGFGGTVAGLGLTLDGVVATAGDITFI